MTDFPWHINRYGYILVSNNCKEPAMSEEITNSAENPGHFQKGQSGNPAGRPLGARNRATVAAEALLEGEAERLTREAIERALDSGDSALLRFCLSRILPPARGQRVTLELFEGNHAEAVAATVEAVATGLISPLEASGVAALLEGQRRAVETLDLEQRLAHLEGYTGDPEHFARRRLQAEPPCPSLPGDAAAADPDLPEGVA
jgi:hypothetical protein